jgi:hypothetical protein
MSSSENVTIKDIPDVPPEVFKAARNGKLVVFIGAGVSRIVGCPSWNEFAHKQLQDLYEKKALNYYEYTTLKTLDARKLLSICRKLYDERRVLPESMRILLKARDELIKKSTIYKDLYDLNAIYVTTNFDDYLDVIADQPIEKPTSFSGAPASKEYAEKDFPRGKVFHSKENLLLSHLVNGNIIHIHGSVKDEGKTIVTIVDYMRHYEAGAEPSVFLEAVFNSYTVLFVGYGLEEYEVLEFVINKAHPAKKELKHFLLYPIFKNEVNLLAFQRKYYADLGIQLIPYPKDENGYDQLAIVIREWSKEIGPIARPQGFFERIKLIDEEVK